MFDSCRSKGDAHAVVGKALCAAKAGLVNGQSNLPERMIGFVGGIRVAKTIGIAGVESRRVARGNEPTDAAIESPATNFLLSDVRDDALIRVNQTEFRASFRAAQPRSVLLAPVEF